MSPRVGLFVTCLVDLFRPTAGLAAIQLLEQAGCQVFVPRMQTCCGQPAYNSGDLANAKAIAQQVVSVFEEFDYVVAPSGSCASMLRNHYPCLLSDDPALAARAAALAAKSYELTSFLVDVRGHTNVEAKFAGRVTYHDSCSGLRELSVRDAPRTLLCSVEGLELVELNEAEVCCGFGGTFAVKYSDISGAMVATKVQNIAASGAGCVVGADLGCLINIAGRLEREGHAIDVRHVAEVLAGMADAPGIGAPKNRQVA
jgi:L-lactate dehydrogenase complex protein LldE